MKYMKRKQIFEILLLVSFIIAENPKRNVLLIIVDDLRPSLGCYGDSNAFTPNIDALANKGVVFENAYAQQSLCAPSRNSFLTSRRPDSLHLYDFYSYWRTFAGNYTTLPQHFKDNGYITKSIGKVFHPGVSSNYSDDKISWTEEPFHAKTEKYKEASVCFSKSSPFIPHRNIVCPVVTDIQPGHTLPDIEIADEAITFLNTVQDASKSFFLSVGFHKPHIPLKYPYKYKKLHPLRKIKLPSNRKKPGGLPSVAWNPWIDLRERDDIKALNLSFPFQNIPDKESKLIIQSYYASVSYIDNLIGKILAQLKNKDTIITLIGDHGCSLGQHGEWEKYSNYEVAVRVPFVISIPSTRQSKYNNKIGEIVELVDLFPTLTDLAGINKIPTCPICSKNIKLCTQGKSLAPLINTNPNNIVMNANYIGLSQYPRPGPFPTQKPNSDKPRLKNIKIMGYSLRTYRYRYTEWVEFENFKPNWKQLIATELYDHTIDSDENLNLFYNQSYTFDRKLLSKMLHSKTKQYILC